MVLCFHCLALWTLSICYSAHGLLFSPGCSVPVHHLVPGPGYSVCDQFNLNCAVGALFYFWDSIRTVYISTSVYKPARTMASTFSRSSVMACTVICNCSVEVLLFYLVSRWGRIRGLPLSSVSPESWLPPLHYFKMIYLHLMYWQNRYLLFGSSYTNLDNPVQTHLSVIIKCSFRSSLVGSVVLDQGWRWTPQEGRSQGTVLGTPGACTMIVDETIQSYKIRFKLTNQSTPIWLCWYHEADHQLPRSTQA